MPPDKLSFPYRILPGEVFMAPIASAEIIGPRGRSSLDVLVDSGAAFPIFPASAADEAGIVLTNAAKTTIIYGGGPIDGRMVRYPLVIRDDKAEYRIDNAIMVFVEKLAYSYGLLGRSSVFGHFREVAFLQRRKIPLVEFRIEGLT